ncbi:MAG TPA: DUF4190 domain-containing protein [Pyrinomonadaceae bacterium]|nr:DUF4190 domain-containing protein [Pyrinomonadaceae bacterium]
MSTIRCPQCNLTNFATAVACKRCGYFFQPPAEGATAPIAAPPQTSFGSGGEHQQQAFNEFQPAVAASSSSYTPQPQFGAQPGQNYYQPQYQVYQSGKQKSGLAIASLVLGLIGCFFASPVGLILGIIAVVKANRRPHEYGGKGLAIAGIVLNGLGILFLPVIVAIAVPNLMAARRAANEAGAIATMRAISDAEHKYMASMSGICGDIQTLIAGKLINDLSLAKNEKNGYRFMVANLPGKGCEIHATPLTTSHGTRSFFYSTEDRVMRAADKKGLPADKKDLPLDSRFSGSREDSSPWGQPPGESSAISALRTLHGAEATYAATNGMGSCGTLQDLANSQLIKNDLADGEANGYRFAVKKISQFGCELTATPISGTSARSFYIGNDGVVRGKAKNGVPADKNDPPIY